MKKHGLKLIKISRKELTQNCFCFYFTIIFQKNIQIQIYRTYLYLEIHCICATTLDINTQTKI